MCVLTTAEYREKMRLAKYIQAFTEAAATVHLGSDSVVVGSFYAFATIVCVCVWGGGGGARVLF